MKTNKEKDLVNMTLKRHQGKNFRLTGNDIIGYLFLIPAIFCLWYFTVRPMIMGTYMSFFNMRGYKLTEFCGFDNYIRILNDPMFIKTLWNTIKYVFWSIVIGFAVPILLAIVLNELTHLRSTIRFWVYLPSATPMVAVTMLWYFMYYPNAGGLLNIFISKLGIDPYVWLQDSRMTIIYIIISMTWHGMGSTMMYYFAALQSVNHDLYEAATIDGAGVIRRARVVTLPKLYPIIILFLARQIIGVFSVMQEPMQMTGGGPNGASMSLGLQIYEYAFVNYRPQFALALGVIMFLILMVATCFYFILDRKVEEM